MKLLMKLAVIFFCAFLSAVSDRCQRIVCIFDVKSLFKYEIGSDSVSRCTHLIVNRAEVTNQQEIHFIEYNNESQHINIIKRRFPQLHILLAVQNDVNNYVNFLNMYTNDANRQRFINNTIWYLRNNALDGVKLDVQPKEGGDRGKFTLLFQKFNESFQQEASRTNRPRLLLSAGIPSNKTFLDQYYDVLGISNYVDMVDLATYGFLNLTEVDSRITISNPRHHSPLYSRNASDPESIDYMCRYVAGMGVPKNKTNVGLSMVVTRYYTFDHPGYYISTGWITDYSSLCRTYHLNATHTLEPDKGMMTDGPVHFGYLHARVFYDNTATLKVKVKYVKDNHYGGVLLYKASYDDYTSRCNLSVINPLLKAVYEECSTD